MATFVLILLSVIVLVLVCIGVAGLLGGEVEFGVTFLVFALLILLLVAGLYIDSDGNLSKEEICQAAGYPYFTDNEFNTPFCVDLNEDGEFFYIPFEDVKIEIGGEKGG